MTGGSADAASLGGAAGYPRRSKAILKTKQNNCMEKLDLKILEAHDWLAHDQYPHGEWGKCEAFNPTDDFRDMEISRIKPNIFTSSQAVLSLLSTGFARHEIYEVFFRWLHGLRREDGYWTSASGSRIPSGRDRGWSEVRNLRHTSKALDLLMLTNEFVPADAAIVQEILDAQCENGAFAQHPGSVPDLWSTAYVMNMIIRCLHADNLHKSLPRKTTMDDWAVILRNHLDKARAWLCSELSEQGVWGIDQKDPLWITEALLSEVGGDLSIHRPDLCQKVAYRLLDRAAPDRALGIWGLLLILPVLSAQHQQRVLNLLDGAQSEKLPAYTFEVTSYLKVLWLAKCPHILSYYVRSATGHESALTKWAPWDTTEYTTWCIKMADTEQHRGSIRLHEMPANKAEAWLAVTYLINAFRIQIEQSRGWELLWSPDQKPRNERSAQIAFWNVAGPLTEGRGLLVREPETGIGPVDFSFANGFHTQVHLEFKLASNSRLEHGFGVQLPSYMAAADVDSAFYVVIGYDEEDSRTFRALYEKFSELKNKNPHIFISLEYVDARRRESASR